MDIFSLLPYRLAMPPVRPGKPRERIATRKQRHVLLVLGW